MSDPVKTAVIDAPTRATTPPSIFLALVLFAFAIATPLLADLDSRDAKGDGGWATLRVMLDWMLAGGAAVITGIICTIVGARHSPRSAWTRLAIFLAGFAGLGVFFFLSQALR